jgi:hypothetical protein
MLIREDVERIVEGVLKDLTLEMMGSTFTDPNDRTIVLKLNGREIDRVTFNIVQRREYEG